MKVFDVYNDETVPLKSFISVICKDVPSMGTSEATQLANDCPHIFSLDKFQKEQRVMYITLANSI